jgi:hypothetical protein
MLTWAPVEGPHRLGLVLEKLSYYCSKEIRQICEELDWFLTHRMVKIILYDLEQQTESILQQKRMCLFVLVHQEVVKDVNKI